MKLHKLVLTDFRNYERTLWEPTASISIFTGINGSGKTNLLEALSLLSPGHGLRNVSYALLPKDGKGQWSVYAEISRNQDYFSLATGKIKEGTSSKKRSFFLNEKILKYQSDVAHYYASLWLTPQMDRLFQENPSGRRRFLDRLTLSLYPEHSKQIAAYERSLSNRNRLLITHPYENLWLDAVEDSMSRHAVAITFARMSFIENINLQSFQHTLFPKTLLSLHCPIAEKLKKYPALQVEEWVRSCLKKNRLDDKEKGGAHFGAHRADFSLYDQKTNRQAIISSNGQQKIMLLGVILCHAYYLSQNWNFAPFILLDEPLTHLDERYRHALLEILPHLQANIFLTGTDKTDFETAKSYAEFISVENGLLRSDNARNASL